MPSSTRSSSTFTAASVAPLTLNLIWATASRAIWRRLTWPALYIARPKWYALAPAISVRSRSKKAAAVNRSQKDFAFDDLHHGAAHTWAAVVHLGVQAAGTANLDALRDLDAV